MSAKETEREQEVKDHQLYNDGDEKYTMDCSNCVYQKGDEDDDSRCAYCTNPIQVLIDEGDFRLVADNIERIARSHPWTLPIQPGLADFILQQDEQTLNLILNSSIHPDHSHTILYCWCAIRDNEYGIFNKDK